MPGAGVRTTGLVLYGCDTGVAASGWTLRYVAPGGTGAGTQASPHPTITAALQSASATAKVVLCVAAGSYQETLNLGSNRSIVLAGGFNTLFSARSPAATPSKLQPALPASDVISASSPDMLTIDGMEVTGGGRRGIQIALWDAARETVTLLNNHIHHNGATANHGAAATGGVSIGGGALPTIVVSNNVIEFNHGWHHGGGLNIGGGAQTINPLLRGTANDGFGALSSQANGLATVSYNIIRNNQVHEPTLPHGAGAALGMNTVVDHNEFSGNDTIGAGAGYGVGGALIAQHGTSADSSQAIALVTNNWFEGNRAGKAGAAVFVDQTHAGLVMNNVMTGNTGPGTVLVDGACSNSCAGTLGNNDRNFVTIAGNTIVNNAGAGVAVQDATAHLYFNVIWNNGAADDVLLMNGSAGADNIVRGANNIISSSNAGLTGTIHAGGVPNVVNAQHRLSSDTVGGVLAAAGNPAFTPAFAFSGSLARGALPAQDVTGAARLRPDGRYLYGAFATPQP